MSGTIQVTPLSIMISVRNKSRAQVSEVPVKGFCHSIYLHPLFPHFMCCYANSSEFFFSIYT